MLLVLFIILIILVPLCLYMDKIGAVFSPNFKEGSQPEQSVISSVPEDFVMAEFEDSDEGRLAEYGHQLITKTYALIGPQTELAITGNRLSCSSCHLQGGTKPYGGPFIGLTGVFPIYIGREDKIVSLEERVNGCFERSMNGKAIDVNSKEMRAIISYIKHLSKGTVVGQRLKGQGFVDLKIPDRAADTDKGALVYKSICSSCHGDHGQGQLAGPGENQGGYLYPALWGPDSYNDGAGMSRVLTAAKFIKGNMPFGVTHDAPALSDEQAYDVAAYINSFPRPQKAHKERDYPNLKKKPMDSPYPPYADSIPQLQHKYGPFNFAE